MYSHQVSSSAIGCVLAAMTTTNWLVFDRTWQGIALAGLCAVAAPLSEVLLNSQVQAILQSSSYPGQVHSWYSLGWSPESIKVQFEGQECHKHWACVPHQSTCFDPVMLELCAVASLALSAGGHRWCHGVMVCWRSTFRCIVPTIVQP